MLHYHIAPRNGQTKCFYGICSVCGIWYFTKNEMKKLHSDKEINIIGEIGGFSHSSYRADVLVLENGAEIPILPRGSSIWPFERIIGYTKLKNNGYLAVVSSLLSVFCRFNRIRCRHIQEKHKQEEIHK